MALIYSLLLVFCATLGGCAVTKDEYAYLADSSELVLVVDKKSYFDPDGFSRTYSGKLDLSLGNTCDDGIRNNLSVECQLGTHFTLPKIYEEDCSEGFIKFRSQGDDLEVSFDGSGYPCEYFSNSYPLKETIVHISQTTDLVHEGAVCQDQGM